MLKIFVTISIAVLSASAVADDRLAPLPNPSTVLTRIAIGSCADEELPQPIWSVILEDKPELFLFMGDNVYADINRGERVQDYRRSELEFAYGLLAKHDDFKPFRAQVPMLATWDDHDFGKNDAGVEFELKGDAKELMIDTLGVPQETAMLARDGVYHAAIFGAPGRRLQIIMLDTRWFRSPLKVTDEPGAKGKERYLPDDSAEKTILGEEQWRWLEEQLQKPAELRLLVSSIQVVAEGHGWEAWRNLPLEQKRLFDLLKRTDARNTIVLSGDRHIGGLYQRQIADDFILTEMTSSSLNLPWTRWNPGKSRVEETGPHQIGDMMGHANYGIISIDWDEGRVSLALKDEKGASARSLDVAFR